LTSTQNRHVAFVSFVGLWVREQELLALGITLPGLGKRRDAVAELPALGLLTLAAFMPDDWTCSYHEVDVWEESLIDQIAENLPHRNLKDCDKRKDCGHISR
jgi:hypothetical protein